MDPNLTQIRSFVAIGKLGSFTRAARAVHLSQPALTVQIRQLESALNVKILDRNTRSVRLTRVGEELLPVFERLLNEFDTVVTGAKDLATRRLGVVRLACLPSFAAAALPKAIVAFRARYPGIQFMLKDGVGRKIVSLVKSEAVDFGIAGGEVNDPDVKTEALTRDHMRAIYLSPHALDKEKKITAEILARQPLILMDEDSTVRQVIDLAFEKLGLSVRPALEATYMSTAVGMARAKLGVAVVPSTAIEAQTSGRLKSRLIEGRDFGRSIVIVRKTGRSLPPASESFIATLVASFSNRLRNGS
jgi:DNA-binding transcriptional LysR family regulator